MNGAAVSKNAGRRKDFEQREGEHQRATATAMEEARRKKGAEDKRLHAAILDLEHEIETVAGRLEDLRHLQVVQEAPALPKALSLP